MMSSAWKKEIWTRLKEVQKCLIVIIKVTLTSECPVSYKVLARVFRNVYIDVYIWFNELCNL